MNMARLFVVVVFSWFLICPTSGWAETISDAQIEIFLRVDNQIRLVQFQADQQIKKVFDASKVSIEEYNAMVQKISTDKKFLERVKKIFEGMAE